jgi:4-amino-4-deoxy-L-arabinose transferase-like glycosyltransferase
MTHPSKVDGVILPKFAWRPVSVVTAIVVVTLGATVNEYGYFRDELYFRVLGAHPAWGYVDEPPLTPLLVRGSTAIFGDSLWALRLPAILCAAATLIIVALIARELGGGAYAQTVAAIGAAASFLLVAGHVLLTATPDMVFWSLAILLIVRALLRQQDRWWIWTGVTVGIAFYNKQLILLLLIGLGAGLLIAGPRQVLKSRALWLGALIAVVIALPTLIWQVTNHFPELKMSHAIAVDKGPNDRITYIPFQLVLVAPLWIGGFIATFKDLRLKALAWAYVVVSGIVLITGGQVYYAFGLLALFMAVAAVRLEKRGKRLRVGIILAVSLAIWSLLALPLVPASALHSTPIGDIDQTVRDQVGWPAYVQEIAAAYATLSPADQQQTTIIVGNYGELGALDRFGGRYHLPQAYSGQNQLYYYGPPPASATIGIFVSYTPADLAGYFASCAQVGTLDDRIGVDNEEQGIPITICRTPTSSWAANWPLLQHYS